MQVGGAYVLKNEGKDVQDVNLRGASTPNTNEENGEVEELVMVRANI